MTYVDAIGWDEIDDTDAVDIDDTDAETLAAEIAADMRDAYRHYRGDVRAVAIA